MEVTKKKEREEQGQEGKKAGIDPAIIEELTHYLGYAKGEAPQQEEGQRREKPPQWQQQKDLNQRGGEAGDRSSARSERRV
jgi:hypothetical protein